MNIFEELTKKLLIHDSSLDPENGQISPLPLQGVFRGSCHHHHSSDPFSPFRQHQKCFESFSNMRNQTQLLFHHCQPTDGIEKPSIQNQNIRVVLPWWILSFFENLCECRAGSPNIERGIV